VGNFGRNVFHQLDFFASLENTYSSHRRLHRTINGYHGLEAGRASSLICR
jgi:hypothetical protein